MKKLLILVAAFWFPLAYMACAQDPDNKPSAQFNLEGILGTYANPPRMENERVDLQKLFRELEEIQANTYNWLVWTKTTDWDDLKLFLPLAKEKKIRVWVTLVPPTESKPIAQYSSEPYGLDYERWAREIAMLSLEYPNLVAWSIDDFAHNLKFYTPEYLGKVLANASEVNPALAFIPCVYYKQITPSFVEAYKSFFHGILFPYRAESHTANLTDHQYVEEEITRVREMFGGKHPVFLDIYATAHSRLGDSTPEYVQKVLEAGRRSADGVLIYCHQDPEKSAQKFQVLKKGFK